MLTERYKRLGKNTIVIFIGSAGGKIVSFLMLPFYTRWLSVSDYGITDMITVYATLLIGLFSCCITDSIFIFPKGQDDVRKKEYLSSALVFLFSTSLIASLVFGCLKIGSLDLGMKNTFFDYIWYIYLIIISQMFQQLFQQFARSNDRIVVYGMSGVVQTTINAVLSFCLIPQFGIMGFVIAQVLANVITSLYSITFSKSWGYLSLYSVQKERCKEMLVYSVPLIPNGIMWWLVNALNRPLLENYVGLRGIGLYAIANKFPGILGMVFTVFALSWQISVLEEYGKEGFGTFYNKTFRMIFLGLVFVFFVIVLLSHLLVELFTTPDYYEAWMFIPVLTLAIVFSSMSSFSGSIFSAIKKSKYYFYSSVWGGGTAIIFNFVLVPRYGIWGATFSVMLSFLVMALSRLGYSWKYVKISNTYRCVVTLALCIAAVFTPLLTSITFFYIFNSLALLLIFIVNCDLNWFLLLRKI